MKRVIIALLLLTILMVPSVSYASAEVVQEIGSQSNSEFDMFLSSNNISIPEEFDGDREFPSIFITG